MSTLPLGHMARRPQAALDLVLRYHAVFRSAWTHRRDRSGKSRPVEELDFLPAALSLQDTPVHPAPRRLAWGMIVAFTIACLWSFIGQVDVVAVAQGRIIVSDRTKPVQPLEAGVVRAVSVKDGDHVEAGQVLVELDATMVTADRANVQEQLASAVSEEQRTAALQRALQSDAPGHDLRSAPLGNTVAVGRAQVRGADGQSTGAQLQAEWQDILAKLSKFDAESARRQSERSTVLETMAKLEAIVPLAQLRESDYQKLVEQGFVSGHATQDKTRERITLERDLATQHARLAETQSAMREAEMAKLAYLAETRRLLGDRHAQATTRRHQLEADASKAGQRVRLTRLTAPVSGVVQQLAVHTAGAVVTEAQTLMIIVPDSAHLSAEVSVANQDIGFVDPGQVAQIKLETFPYTQYGTVPATVAIVTADAVMDDKKGFYYPATLTLSQKEIVVDGKRLRLSPGMNVTAEIKTGQRRVIEYLLSPLLKAGSESFRER